MSGASGAATVERDSAGTRRGSRFSDKQIAHVVKDHRAIEVTLYSGEELSGWVYGMDDFHIGIVDSFGDLMLVHKSAAAVIKFTDQVSTENHVARQICDPFRNRVMKDHFGQTSAAQ